MRSAQITPGRNSLKIYLPARIFARIPSGFAGFATESLQHRRCADFYFDKLHTVQQRAPKPTLS